MISLNTFRLMTILLISFLLVFCTENSTPSQNNNNSDYVLGQLQNTPITAPATGDSITIDGTLNESEWQSAYSVQIANNHEIKITYSD